MNLARTTPSAAQVITASSRQTRLWEVQKPSLAVTTSPSVLPYARRGPLIGNGNNAKKAPRVDFRGCDVLLPPTLDSSMFFLRCGQPNATEHVSSRIVARFHHKLTDGLESECLISPPTGPFCSPGHRAKTASTGE